MRALYRLLVLTIAIYLHKAGTEAQEVRAWVLSLVNPASPRSPCSSSRPPVSPTLPDSPVELGTSRLPHFPSIQSPSGSPELQGSPGAPQSPDMFTTLTSTLLLPYSKKTQISKYKMQSRQSLSRGTTRRRRCLVDTKRRNIRRCGCSVDTTRRNIRRCGCSVDTTRRNIRRCGCLVDTVRRTIHKRCTCLVDTARRTAHKRCTCLVDTPKTTVHKRCTCLVDTARRTVHKRCTCLVDTPRGTARRRRSTESSVRRVQYRGLYSRKFRLQGEYPLYLTPDQSGSVIVIAAQRSGPNNHACFRVHTFDVLTPYPEGGQVVVFQMHDGSHFLHGDATGTLFLSSAESSVTSLNRTDDKFFLLYSPRGASHYRIKHLTSGRFLSAGQEQVTLADVGHQGFTDNMHFEIFSCNRS
ncbi:uncharacterized protein [Procambarus clarkii]|uniref:uncharacterized protein n=1 Tax=Procambarus clarkii TaxID=6728 RepID=UPI001E674621|nr:uncharacterized protein LOC123746546 [Procambarus clarkii]